MDTRKKDDNADFGNFGPFLDITEKSIMLNLAKNGHNIKRGYSIKNLQLSRYTEGKKI
jgi:hypothetical protein